LQENEQKRLFGARIYSVKKDQICPACAKEHPSDNDDKIRINLTRRAYIVRCFRNRVSGGESILEIPRTKEAIEEIKKNIKNAKIDTTQRFLSERIPTMDKEYVDFDLKADLLFVKSAMGSGKTEVLARNIKDLLPGKSVVMVSVRHTLSTEWFSRYSRAGIQMVDYRDIQG
jgi:late competence protein required for DNA uptake (superfamily II DNA/RNA helicase)